MTTYQSETKLDNTWHPIQKPAEIAESRLVKAILDGTFSINSHLPGERELSEALGVTRPTLREALQRLARDGWLEIHQGKTTRIRDYWKEGKLGVLNTLSEHQDQLPENFIPNLLNARLAMAPMYTGLAVAKAHEKVVHFLEERFLLKESPELFTEFDWSLQHELTLLSDNPVFVMIFNSFRDVFLNLAPRYFSIPAARHSSMTYYENLANAAYERDDQTAKMLTEDIMHESLRFWREIKS